MTLLKITERQRGAKTTINVDAIVQSGQSNVFSKTKSTRAQIKQEFNLFTLIQL